MASSSSSSSSNAPMGKKVTLSSALERNGLGSMDQKAGHGQTLFPWDKGLLQEQKLLLLRPCIVASAIPMIASVRILPWARANLNPTAQALIISTDAGAVYFIVADKTVLASARKNSFERAQLS